MEKTEFTQFNLNQSLIDALTRIGFNTPTQIQEMCLPHVLDGSDIFALAETGSGKTGAFAIPIIHQILEAQVNGEEKGLYVILSPTRELAQQTDKVIKMIAQDLDIKTVCVIGGESIEKQKEILELKPNIIVATPGRLLDVIKSTKMDVSIVKGVVFDEADRLFDMGFKKDIEYILKDMPDSRQFIMVSATTNFEVMSMAYKFKSNPIEIKLSEEKILVDNIDDKIAMIQSDEKMPYLVNLLNNHIDTYAIIFCNTQYQTHLLAQWLIDNGFKAKAISGRLPQNQRTKLMEEFHAKTVTILVCTDVAARGLDIKDINLVVNFDLPSDPANYVHRIGRTGRAGKKGEAISFCSFEDCENLDAIIALIGKSIPKVDIDDSCFATNVTKRPRIEPKSLKSYDEINAEKRADAKAGKNSKNNKPVKEKPYKKVDLILNLERPDVANDSTNKKEFLRTILDNEKINTLALDYFKINDESLLKTEVLKKGMKKFFFFGPRKITYKVVLKPVYKKLLSPLLTDIINLLKLRVKVNVSFKGNVILSFEGADIEILKKNNSELLASFEQISWSYLIGKIDLPRHVKVISRVFDQTYDEAKAKNTKNSKGPNTNGPKKFDDSDFAQIIEEAKQIKEKVVETKTAILMRPLNAAQRRQVHELLGDDKLVKTNSIGDGRLKQIEISYRQ